VLFSGFQAEHTLGRKILDGAEFVPILGRDYRVAAKIRRAEGLSAHADCDELQSWAVRTQQQGQVEQVLLVHGEPGPAVTLASTLTTAGLPNVSVPERGQVVQL
jgi:metallo-beta-lactamase family protein